MFNYLKSFLHTYCRIKTIIFVLMVTAIICACSTYFVISIESKEGSIDPNKVIGLLLVDLIIFLVLAILVAYKIFQNFFGKSSIHDTFKLQSRMIIAFSLVAAVPTIIVSVFSAYFFNSSIQLWFDKKISEVLDQSIIVAQSYITEHKLHLEETALAVAEDLDEIYYDLIHNPVLFSKFLNEEAAQRLLDEVIVFNKSANLTVANSYLSFSLSFTTIPAHLIKKADSGEIVEVKSDPTKIRVLVKLREYNDLYLLVGRFIDNKIIDHVDKTNGAAGEYYRLKNQVGAMQIKFSIIFIFVALLLLLIAVSFGIIFTTKIVNPIKKLVIATDKVKEGDLTIQVPENEVDKDEIGALYAAFNRMIKKLAHQQRDLVIAQRALAWSDVARKVAHEIKNPLTPILLASERLSKKFIDHVDNKEEFINYLQMIIRHTNDIKKIVSEFVLFARLPAPTFVHSNLIDLIKNIIESRKLINDKITYSYITRLHSIDFICDPSQINQVMINLLKNAEESIEASKQNVQGKISVIVSVVDSMISVVMIDNGKGFPPELIGRATEAYITSSTRGMGLGLAIVKKIVEEHCGTLDITNLPEGGAKISIEFNLTNIRNKVKN